MTHIFKPGDRAYWIGVGWVELFDNHDKKYPLITKRFSATFTANGQRIDSEDIVLLPINPYDPSDPNNPPEFRNPFIHEGRVLRLGDEIVQRKTGGQVGRISQIQLFGANQLLVYCGFSTFSVGDPDYTFADFIPQKKTTYLWAIPVFAVRSESEMIEFKRMTQEEGEKVWGAKIVPDSEKEE